MIPRARRTLTILVLVAAASACSSASTTVSKFAGPSAAAVFQGVTRKLSGMASYVAVADSRGNELRILDPADLQPVVAPGLAFPLSVVTAPRPLLLASASLGDGGADVLAVGSVAGVPFNGGSGPAIQIVETWTADNRVAYDVPIPGIAPGAELRTLTGFTVPATSTAPAVARIVVGVTGGVLAVVDFSRATDGSGAVVASAVRLQTLTFTPEDVAVEPGGTNLYVATRDPITISGSSPVVGVARVDASGDPALPFPVTALGALAPTVSVAAALVDDRQVDSSNGCSPANFTGTPVLYVYAVLDPSACGFDQPIACGVATLDPTRAGAVQLALDPSARVGSPGGAVPGGAFVPVPAQTFRAPMPVPGVATHIAIAKAPSSGTQRVVTDVTGVPSASCPTHGTPASPLFELLPSSGARTTSAFAAVTSTDGNVYWLDLSRWGPVNEVSTVTGSSRVTVTGGSQLLTAAATDRRVGLWTDIPAFGVASFTPSVQVDPTAFASAVQVWPGFTDGGTWTVAWQGPLPALTSRAGIVSASASGELFVAAQTATGDASAPWNVGASVGDAALGVHAGDVVELTGCETRVAAVVPADLTTATAGVAVPGGAARLDTSVQLPAGCLGALAPGQAVATIVTVRAAGFVLTHDTLGYLGRPGVGTTTDPDDGVFELRWSSEDALPAGSEALAIARKARRRFYPAEGPCPQPGATSGTQAALAVGCYGLPRLWDPLAPGPALRFRVGLLPPVTPDPANPSPPPARGAGVSFTTQNGLSTTFRRPSSGGVLPAGPVPVDRTALPGAQRTGHENDPIQLFVPFDDDQALAFSPSQASGSEITIR